MLSCGRDHINESKSTSSSCDLDGSLSAAAFLRIHHCLLLCPILGSSETLKETHHGHVSESCWQLADTEEDPSRGVTPSAVGILAYDLFFFSCCCCLEARRRVCLRHRMCLHGNNFFATPCETCAPPCAVGSPSKSTPQCSCRHGRTAGQIFSSCLHESATPHRRFCIDVITTSGHGISTAT